MILLLTRSTWSGAGFYMIILFISIFGVLAIIGLYSSKKKYGKDVSDEDEIDPPLVQERPGRVSIYEKKE